MKKIKVVKIGGNVIDDQAALEAFLNEFARLKGPKVLVHGGGKLATRLAKQMNVPVHMVDGRRITDAATLDIITMVYAGKINKTIVAKLQGFGCNAVGFTGADGNTIVSHKRPVKSIDYGFVGDVDTVNSQVISLLLEHKITPVFCALTCTQDGQLLNTNADTIASELAIGLSKKFLVELYYCFEKNGVLNDVTNENSVVENIDKNKFNKMKAEGTIADGMIPKLDNCFHAVDHNVLKVCLGKPEMLFKQNVKFTTIQNI